MGGVVKSIAGSILGKVVGAAFGGPFGAIVGAVVSFGFNAAFASKPKEVENNLSLFDSAKQRGTLLNVSNNSEPIPVLYGSRRVGGARVFAEATGGSNEYLHLVIVWSEGPISAINNLYIDDTLSTDGKYSGLLDIHHHLGEWGQAADANLVSRVTNWTNDHKLDGCAYTYIRLKWDQNKFSGFPVITADIDGRTVYDPRDLTTKFSDNPALCLYDYLTNSVYGRNIEAANIDTASFVAAANYCDQLVSVPDGNGGSSTQKRYTCNGLINIDEPQYKNTKSLLTSCRGMLVFTAGTYKLIIDKPETASFTFDEDNITGGWSISLGTKENKKNKITAVFNNPARSYQPDFAIEQSVTYLTEDNDIELKRDIDLPFTNNSYMAHHLAQIELKQTRNPITCSFNAFLEGIRVEVGDVFYITHTTPGWVNKEFRCVSIELLSVGEVKIKAMEYSANVYTLDTLSDADDPPDTNLPDPFTIGDASSLTLASGTSHLLTQNDGTVVSRIFASWTAAADEFITAYEVEWKKSSEGTFNQHAEVDSLLSNYYIAPVQDGVNYDVRVRSRNAFGIHGNWQNATTNVIGKTAAPVNGASLVTAGVIQGVELSFARSADADISHYKIYRSADNNRANASVVGQTDADVWLDGDKSEGDSFYYWYTAVDTSGLESDYYPVSATGGVQGTAGGIENASLTAAKYLELRNTYPWNFSDSLDSVKPFYVPFHIATETITIKKILLNYSVENFRSLSATSEVVAVGTHTHSKTIQQGISLTGYDRLMFDPSDAKLYYVGSTDNGDYTITLSSEDGHQQTITVEYSGDSVGKTQLYPSAGTDQTKTGLAGVGGLFTISTNEQNLHEHEFSVGDAAPSALASHWLHINSSGDLAYSGTGSFTGTRTLNTKAAGSSHSHDNVAGIYEDTSTGITITVDVKDGKLSSAAPWSNIFTNKSGDVDEEDITAEFSSSGWKTLRFQANKLARVNGALFFKLDINA